MAKNPQDARLRFAANVKWRCGQRGYSVDQLVERSEVGKDVLEGILHGEAEADFESISRLAGALDVRPGMLFEGVAWIPEGEGDGRYRVDRPDV